MQLIRWLGVVAIVGATSPAAADILVWRDSAGISHYTNDVANVPAEYRKDAMTVAKDWARAAPPPEPVPVTAPALAPAVADDGRATRDTYDAAGRRAAADDEGAVTNVGTVVQNIQVEPSAPGVVDRLVPVPVLVERRGSRRAPPRDDDVRESRNNFPPASRAPYLQGPAGPPPISDR
jgi:YD repeat-containing protein